MRIIGGKYRGKKLFSPEADTIRPTSDRAREAVFNILYSKLEKAFADYAFLDVFAGTGAVGLEAVSRGFAEAGFVDVDLRCVRKNAAQFQGEIGKMSFYMQDAAALLPASRRYDVVFLDAPYKKGLSIRALSALREKNWLADGALCIVETERGEKLDIPDGFEKTDERRYGIARLVFLKFAIK